MSVCCIQSDWCALAWNVTFTLYNPGDMCLFVSYGHVGCWLVLLCWHWSGSTPQFLLMELILGIPTCFVLDFTLHAYNVFSIYLGPSIIKLCTDHILSSTITSVCLVPICYMLVLLYDWQFIMAHVFFVHVHCMIVIHFQACTHVISNAHYLIISLGLWSGMGCWCADTDQEAHLSFYWWN